jgi:hypothetical protein
MVNAELKPLATACWYSGWLPPLAYHENGCGTTRRPIKKEFVADPRKGLGATNCGWGASFHRAQ